MRSWLVIRPEERAPVLAALHRPIVRATVSASLTTIRTWARNHGVSFNQRTSHLAIDAYIEAQYKESNANHPDRRPDDAS